MSAIADIVGFIKDKPRLHSCDKAYCLSSNPNAIHLLEANLDKIDWNAVSINPNAIHLLEANLDKINWKKILIKLIGIVYL